MRVKYPCRNCDAGYRLFFFGAIQFILSLQQCEDVLVRDWVAKLAIKFDSLCRRHTRKATAVYTENPYDAAAGHAF